MCCKSVCVCVCASVCPCVCVCVPLGLSWSQRVACLTQVHFFFTFAIDPDILWNEIYIQQISFLIIGVVCNCTVIDKIHGIASALDRSKYFSPPQEWGRCSHSGEGVRGSTLVLGERWQVWFGPFNLATQITHYSSSFTVPGRNFW